ncbi:Cell wall-associated hydrolase, NlpC family [Corynebacterium mycetoides]|uniref:Cell wall-associated hydrolase, NlpC family n=1 Tax=Corynebacterium mycetoides TaxID=38302 RepID=A0A1G9NAI5_9CORY|nr:C40 family peptidase [Corynebacterium mycetoides]SDL83508.1 Cell wall-associated hydrolase, NlpC family [Corynebacterium mycetoides]
MGKHSFTPRRRGVRASLSFATAATVAASGFAPAHADDVDALIEELASASDEATAKMEQIKDLEVQIDEAQRTLDRSVADVAAAQARTNEARLAREAQQSGVNSVAASTYRTLQVDNVVNALGSDTPQEVIDKSTYLGSVARSRQNQLEGLRAATQDVIDSARAADVAKAEAQYTRGKLQAQRDRLESERQDIEKRIQDVEARVDALSPEARQAWANQGNPVSPDLLAPAAFASGITGAALAQLGKPYGWGASGPDAFDCSGLMVWAYAQNGKSIPRTSQAQLAGGTPVPLSQLQPGDIVGYYPGVTHVGMYIGNGQVVHASDYGIPVQVVPLNSMPIQGAVRY